MKKSIFNFMLCLLPTISCYSANASKKADFSDFLTEKDQTPHKSYPYYSKYQNQYVGVDLEEELVMFRKVLEKDQTPHKLYPYHPMYQRQYVGVDLEEQLAMFRRVNNGTFYRKLINVMPRILRFAIFKK